MVENIGRPWVCLIRGHMNSLHQCPGFRVPITIILNLALSANELEEHGVDSIVDLLKRDRGY